MPTSQYAGCHCALHSIYRIFISMPPVNSQQSTIQSTFNTVFNQKKSLSVQDFKILQQFVRHTIGTCTDNQPNHIIHSQGLFIHSLQPFQFTIRIGISLKIS
ncbi:hypothetical protein EVA_14518 [gut metagenome]|uniref:Uncharacterized protein n=1 Tax=gut metagenome TaxID=749906 RepID=J9GDB5_9ZZZZ